MGSTPSVGSGTGVEEPRTHALRRDIGKTQREMSETIHEIEHRLSPRNLMQQTKTSVRRAGVNTSHKFIDQVKENPIPAAMVGVGLWLLLRNSGDGAAPHYRDDVRDYPSAYEEPSKVDRMKEKASDAVDTAREKVSHLADTTMEKVSHLADTTKEKVSDVAESTRETASHLMRAARTQASAARWETRDFLRESPLVVGLAAVALGAIVAAVIPETAKEDELLGATRDRLLDRGKDLAHEGIDKAKHVAEVATVAAQEEVRSMSTTDATGSAAPSFR
jgi:ElaB/YqjD/DUF883 family membrane-anchored ribosome-binding protein